MLNTALRISFRDYDFIVGYIFWIYVMFFNFIEKYWQN